LLKIGDKPSFKEATSPEFKGYFAGDDFPVKKKCAAFPNAEIIYARVDQSRIMLDY